MMWQHFLLLGIVSFLTQNVYGESSQCPEKFSLFEGKCYRAMQASIYRWDNANHKCQEFGAQLIEIKNEEQMRTLSRYLLSLKIVHGEFWTGDISHELLSQWTIDGSGDGIDSDDEDDVYMDRNCMHIKYWNREIFASKKNCKELKKFICEAKTLTDKKPESKFNTIKCPEKFKLIDEKCYYLEQDAEMTLDSARNKCTQHNAEVANIKNEKEFNVMQKELFTNRKALEEFQMLTYDSKIYLKNILFKYNDSETCLSLVNFGFGTHTNIGNCSKPEWILCETTTDIVKKTVAVAPVTNDGYCFKEFTKIGNKCYFFGTTEKIYWFDAVQRCNLRNAKLVKIENEVEMNALNDYLLQLDYKDSFWTGGNCKEATTTLRWNEEDEVVNYTKWHGMKPSLMEYYYSMVELSNIDGEYFMNVLSGYNENYYICETNLKKKTDVLETNTGNESAEIWNRKPTEEKPTCPKDFQQIGKKCYHFEDKSDWFDATERCEAINSRIARIENSLEMTNLNKFLLNNNINNDLWISGDDIINSGTFVWGRQDEKVTYTHIWNDNDIRDENIDSNCFGLYKYQDEFYMKLFKCRNEKSFICEVKAEGLPDDIEIEEPATTTIHELIPETTTEINIDANVCPKNFIQQGEKCYRIILDKENWFNAQHICSEQNAVVVTIENANEMRILTKYLNENLNESNGKTDDGFWTTGNDLGTENVYRWNSNNKIMSYFKWHKGEPNNYENEDCIQIRYENDEYFMNDMDCLKENRYICETKVASKLPSTTLSSRVTTISNDCEYLKLLKYNLDSEFKIVELMQTQQQCTKSDM